MHVTYVPPATSQPEVQKIRVLLVVQQMGEGILYIWTEMQYPWNI